jgi:hypothetical protein
MKIETYLMRCAADNRDWIELGDLMSQHYSSPCISVLCRSLQPSLIFMDKDGTVIHSVVFHTGYKAYSWIYTYGFCDVVTRSFPNKDSFEVWLADVRRP